WYPGIKLQWLSEGEGLLLFAPERMLHLSDVKGHRLAFIIIPPKLLHDAQVFRAWKALQCDWKCIAQILTPLYKAATTLSNANDLTFIDDVTLLHNQRF